MRHTILTPLLALTVLAGTASATSSTSAQRQVAAQAHQRPAEHQAAHQNQTRAGDNRGTERPAQTGMHRPDARQGRVTGQHQRGAQAHNPRGMHIQPARPSDQRGTSNSPQAQQGGTLNQLGGALRGATRVTFYNGDPLKGAQPTQTIQLTGSPESQATALNRAAQQASFAVIERPGGRVVVDLKATSTQPGQPAPRTPRRR
ncbi:hypothetical protein DEDE109153_15480 [Deinococcus deserti]|uniref:Uncharacterized protein n=1 Tax=Deinococcus deserti (strain DSM 17065 / CIP 109153 / LMG 22923 / VCD115) TaxID=546414 RepID=C1D257_DEIDV|nr:hypothetical protein [Deinococcus deserti]ACO47496.1 Conserved hypothetical protein, precursor [Deinococcus deserti VCD115]